MPKYVALSRSEHSSRTWRRAEGYKFAERDQTVAIVAQETSAACCEMPLGFIRQGDVFELAALLAFNPGDNAYVAPDGRWMMRYIPMALRGHPFHHVRNPVTGQAILCVDEESECLRGGNEGFFTADGTPSEAVQEVMKFQAFLDAARSQTKAAVAALAGANVLVPWEIAFRSGQEVRPLVGFLRIDKDALERIDDKTFLELREEGAIEIAYHQLASMHQLSTVERLSEIKERVRAGGNAKVTQNQMDEFLKSDRLLF